MKWIGKEAQWIGNLMQKKGEGSVGEYALAD